MTIFTMRDYAQQSGIDISDLDVSHDGLVVSIRSIMRIVCEASGVSQIDLVSHRRMQPLATYRQIAYWLCRRMTKSSLPVIARMFGARDHTTILYGVNNVDDWIMEGRPAGRIALQLKDQLEARA